MQARFDSLDPARGERSFRFADPVEELVALAPEEVVPALERLSRAAAAGLHAAGYVAYDAAPAFDPALEARRGGGPLLHFGIFRRREVIEPLEGLEDTGAPSAVERMRPHLTAAQHRERVDAIHDLIAAGDTYQVNLTFPLQGTFRGDPSALYRRLALAQRSAYCALLEFEGRTIVSASPELFFTMRHGEVTLRPMKGTRPRGRWEEEDALLAQELQASEKDRAENLMIVDLLRNDLGRVAEFGSVAVPRLFEIERYPTVHQMTSTITGRLRSECDVVDVFRALFPCGSVTGAPKIRTAQIIHEVEETPRGPYTGAIGFIGPDDATFSVAIRSAVLDRGAGSVSVGIGSGVTAASDAGAEYQECLDKAAFLQADAPEFGLLEALRLELPGGYRSRDAHLDRLAASARYFDFRFLREPIERALGEAAQRLDPGAYKVRIELRRDGAFDLGLSEIRQHEPPARLALATARVDPGDRFRYHKTTRRELYDAAATEHPGMDDVILVNQEGFLTETTRANLVLEIGGERFTPPIASGLLPGVRRAEALRAGEVRERELTPRDLGRADAIYLLSSVRGWRRGILGADREGDAEGRG